MSSRSEMPPQTLRTGEQQEIPFQRIWEGVLPSLQEEKHIAVELAKSLEPLNKRLKQRLTSVDGHARIGLWTPGATKLFTRSRVPPSFGILEDELRKQTGIRLSDHNLEHQFRQLPEAKLQTVWIAYMRELAHLLHAIDEAKNIGLIWDEQDPYQPLIPQLRQEFAPADHWKQKDERFHDPDDQKLDLMPAAEELLQILQQERTFQPTLANSLNEAAQMHRTEQAPFLEISIETTEQASEFQATFGQNIEEGISNWLTPSLQRRASSLRITRGEIFERKGYVAIGLYKAGQEREVALNAPEVFQSDLRHILLHEFGHAIDRDVINFVGQAEVRATYLQAATSTPPAFSTYVEISYREKDSSVAYSEDFAEALATYFSSPNLLRTVNPERFEAIEQIIKTHFPDLYERREQMRQNIVADRQAFAARRHRVDQLHDEIEHIKTSDEARTFLRNVFPLFDMSPLHAILAHGSPHLVQLLGSHDGKEQRTERYDAKGRLASIEQKLQQHRPVSLFKSPVVDEMGRLISARIGMDTLHLTYGRYNLPTHGRIVAPDGTEKFQIAYQPGTTRPNGYRTILEICQSSHGGRTIQRYSLDASNHITDVEYGLGGERIGIRSFQTTPETYAERVTLIDQQQHPHHFPTPYDLTRNTALQPRTASKNRHASPEA